MPGHTQLKVVLSHVTFPWRIFPCKKSKILMHHFQRYWWLKNPAIWLDEYIFAQRKSDNFNVFHLRLLPAKISWPPNLPVTDGRTHRQARFHRNSPSGGPRTNNQNLKIGVHLTDCEGKPVCLPFLWKYTKEIRKKL